MMTKLTFGKNIAYPVDFIIRNNIIDYIYNKLEDLYKYSYNILNTISKLKFLKKNEHYVSPNYKGFNYLLIFTIINNNNYCIAIDRRKLSYKKEHIDIKLLNIYKLNTLSIPDIMFDGTIFDGKLINNELFLIQDCYYLMGKNMLNINLNEKLNQLNDILNNQLKDNILNFDLKINKLSTYDQLEELILNLSKLPYHTNGLIFLPKLSGVNILFIENQIKKNNDDKSERINNNDKSERINNNDKLKKINNDKSEKINNNDKSEKINNDKSEKINNDNDKSNNLINYDEINNIIYNYTNFLKSREYSYENKDNIKILSLSKTDIPDVYNIYEENNKLGIALIPNLKISHMCESIIKTTELVKFNCIFSEKFKKWIPISVI